MYRYCACVLYVYVSLCKFCWLWVCSFTIFQVNGGVFGWADVEYITKHTHTAFTAWIFIVTKCFRPGQTFYKSVTRYVYATRTNFQTQNRLEWWLCEWWWNRHSIDHKSLAALFSLVVYTFEYECVNRIAGYHRRFPYGKNLSEALIVGTIYLVK